MRPTPWTGLRRLIPRRRRPVRKREVRQEPEVLDEIAAEFTTEELQEFLEADRIDVRADPAFKERLRDKLWEIVRTRAERDPNDRNR